MQAIVNAVKRICKNNRGFTLIELMAVLAVLSIIFSISVPRFTGTVEMAKQKADQVSLEIMNRALEQYIIDRGYTPGELKDLVDEGYLESIPEPQTGGEFKLNGDKDEVILEEK